jgi:hypothetical protein
MTTSQTYQTDDDQLVHAHDQVIMEHNLMTEPEASLAAPEPDLATPEADLATPEADLATPEADLATPEADLATAEPDLTESVADPMTPDSHPADLAEPDADQTAHEDLTSYPAGADSSPGSPSLISGAFTVPESVSDSHPAGDTTSAAGPWSEVQAMFVDDPHASIEQAAGLVDDRVEELIRSVRERQRSMQSAWQADDAGTEELRVALQHYRSFWTSLEDLAAQA